MADLLGRAERSSPEAAQRRAAGAGLDGESAHRAIILVAAMPVLVRRSVERGNGQFAGVSSNDGSCREGLERRLLCASR